MSKLAIFGGDPVKHKPFPGWPVVSKRDEAAIERAFLSGKLCRGEAASALERQLEERTGTRHAVLVSSGTLALELILRGLGIGYGDEVILPPYTFVATLSAILFVGATPVFADIDTETYNICPASAESKVTQKTRAIIAVAVGGCPPSIDRLSELASRKGIHLIIDAAQAIGAKWRGVDIGAYGTAAAFSCQNTKNLTSGEGGIITTNDDALYENIRAMLEGRHEKYFIESCMTELQAAVLTSQLEKLDGEIVTRERMAAYLDARLHGLPFVRPLMREKEVTVNAYHLYIMRFDSDALTDKGLSRDIMLRAVAAEGVPLSAGYLPLYSFPFIKTEAVRRMIGGDIDDSPLKNAEKAGYYEGAWLFQSVLLADYEDMDDIARALIKVWENAGELAARSRKEER